MQVMFIWKIKLRCEWSQADKAHSQLLLWCFHADLDASVHDPALVSVPYSFQVAAVKDECDYLKTTGLSTTTVVAVWESRLLQSLQMVFATEAS